MKFNKSELFKAPEKNKIIIVPNLLSISRIVLAPLLFLAIKDHNLLWIAMLTLWAMFSDFLDGFLARKWQQISKTGKILDPLADKTCLAAAALALGIYGDLPVSLLAIILIRDIIIALLGITIIKKIKMVPVSNIIGKITVVILSLSMLVYILQVKQLYTIAYIAPVVFIFISSASYTWSGLKLFSNKY